MCRSFAALLSIFVLSVSTTISWGQDSRESVYFIGNSLTWDSLNSYGLNSLANHAGTPFDSSQHIRCGSSLTATIGDATSAGGASLCTPTGFGGHDLGQYPDAFASRIDTLVVQPFYGASVREEVGSIQTLIDEVRSHSVNSDTRVLLYSTWGNNRSEGEFRDVWNSHSAQLDAPFVPSRSTYDLILSELALSEYVVEMIPNGQAIASASELLEAGSLGNLANDGDLYRDQIHLSNAGRYLAAVTTLASINGVPPAAELGDDYLPYQFDLPGYGTTPDDIAISHLRGISASTINATAVPEPGTAVVCLCIACAAAIRSRVVAKRGESSV